MKRSTKRTVARQRSASARSGAEVHPRHADDPELGALELAERLEQHVDALVGADEPEAEDHRPLDRGELRGQRPLVGLVGEVVEGAVGDPVDAGRVADQRAQLVGAVLGVGDERVHAREQAALALAAPAPRPAAGSGP